MAFPKLEPVLYGQIRVTAQFTAQFFPNEPNQAGIRPTSTTENQQDKLLGADF
jgi:hypothetical protein